MTDFNFREGLGLRISHKGDAVANLIPNPRFAVNLRDGWSTNNIDTLEWAPGSAPTGHAIRVLKANTSSGSLRCASFLDDQWDGNGSLIPVTEGETYSLSAWVNKDSGSTYTADMGVDWFDKDGTELSYEHYDINDATSGFDWYSKLFTAPPHATMCQPMFRLTYTGTPVHNYGIDVTGVVFRPGPDSLEESEYCDGDLATHRWDGVAHNSWTLFDQTRSWDIAHEAQDIDFTTKVPGGFSELSFAVSRPVGRTYDDLKRNNSVVLSHNGHPLWEGMIHSVEPKLDNSCRIEVKCVGLFQKLRDDDTFRRVYADMSLRSWKSDQDNDQAGHFYHDRKNRLHIHVAKNVWVDSGGCHRLYYWLFDGIPEGDRICRITFDYDCQLGTDGWKAELLVRDDPNDGSRDDQDGSLLWSKTSGTPSGTDVALTLSPKRRCLVLRLLKTGGDAAAEGERWVKLTNVTVYATTVDPPRVDNIIHDIVDGLAPATDIALPPSSGAYDVDHAVFHDFTTRAKAVHEIAHFVDGEYDYGFWDNGTFRAGDRPDGSDIPAARTYMLTADRAGMIWDVRRDYDHSFDGVIVRYKRPDKGDANPLAELCRPAGGASRVKVLDHSPHRHMTTKLAARIARRFLARHASASELGSVTLTGDVTTKNGIVVPAAFIRAGDWIENMSLPGHRPLCITKSQVNLETGEVTLRINDGDRRHLKHQLRWVYRQNSKHGSLLG